LDGSDNGLVKSELVELFQAMVQICDTPAGIRLALSGGGSLQSIKK
jgi:hypothetical protein